MASENKDELVANFTSVTGVDAERAQFYLESAGWNLDLAMGAYFQDQDDDGGVEGPPAPLVEDPAPLQASAQPAKKPQSRIATFSNLGHSSDDDEERGQAFYAGGSEHSGQQVLGPPKKKKEELVKEMFESAREHGAEVVEPGSSGATAPARPRFAGAGYRLGDTEDAPIDVVPGAPLPRGTQEVDMVLKFWKNGFSVNDGPLREFRDPANAAFLACIKKGEVPPELTRLARGGEVNLSMEDHSTEDYVAPKVPLKAFSGEGQRLGSATPAMTVATPPVDKSGDSAVMNISIDESQPTTNVQIRLADGSRMVAKFNHTHTVGDIRAYIESSRSQYAGANYVLMTTFPNKELTDSTQTLAEGKLLNSSIVQRLK